MVLLLPDIVRLNMNTYMNTSSAWYSTDRQGTGKRVYRYCKGNILQYLASSIPAKGT
jgi:hypothetical protein